MDDPVRCYIGVGSNIRPRVNIERALELIMEAGTNVTAVSTVYRTMPLGGRGQQPYLNCVWEAETAEPPEKVKRETLRRVERELGRVRSSGRYAPRTIDLDLLLYGGLVIARAELTLPDPGIYERPFLAVPIHELNPALIVPDTGTPIAAIAAPMPADCMTPDIELTERLRRIIRR